MDTRGLRQADLVRESGLSRQLVSRLLTKEKPGGMLEDETIAGLARAFPEVAEDPFNTKPAEALGVPADRLVRADPSLTQLTNRALLDILEQRLERRGGTDGKPEAGEKEPGSATASDNVVTLESRGRDANKGVHDLGKADPAFEGQEEWAADDRQNVGRALRQHLDEHTDN